MIELISFDIEGTTFSFRKPRFENYQATHIIPPKTVIAGMIANGLNKGERFYYELLSDFKYCPLVINIQSKFVDLWTAIQGKGSLEGKKGIFYREHLFKASFEIFVYSKKFMNEVECALLNPDNIIYLGKSEDLVKIKNVVRISAQIVRSKVVTGLIPLEYFSYVEKIDWENGNMRTIFPPTEESLIDEFESPFQQSQQRNLRNVKSTREVYIALGGKFILKKEIESYKVNEEYIYLV